MKRASCALGDEAAALDAEVAYLGRVAPLLPALTAANARAERRRLVREVRAGRTPVARFAFEPRAVPREAWWRLDRARALAARSPLGALYSPRIAELELELAMVEQLGRPKQVRPLALRRYGTGDREVAVGAGLTKLGDLARALLDTAKPSPEPRRLPAEGKPSLAALVRLMASRAGLDIEVRVEPRLVASAATGDGTVFLADRLCGVREAYRLSVHEVLGHAVAAANGRAQPLRIVEMGTAGSFGDQEGVALWLEHQAGVLDGSRLRMLAARVLVTDRVHAGASFGKTARWLADYHGFSAEDAVTLCVRGFRGGGVTRDAEYLAGLLRVRRAIEEGAATLDELRAGRVSLGALPILRGLAGEGLFVSARYRPSLAYNLSATASGTSPLTSPPSMAASLTMLELT